MSLQFILGGSGSGKSHRLYTSVIEEAQKNPGKNYIIVVPEQFTMQTQRELVSLHPAHGILNIDILSFQRLAYRVFEETGTGKTDVLTETGKNLILRRVAAQKREDLQFLGSRLDKPGYISEMKSILSELTQYEISQQELEEMIKLAAAKPQLQFKLKDIQVLQKGFREYQKDRFITAEELLDVFCQAADASDMLKNSVLAFDGFTGFTPVQQKALRKLLTLSPRIIVTVTLDARESIVGDIREHELFAMSKKMIHILMQLARETGAELLDPMILPGEKGRFREGSELGFLERNLFRYGKNRAFRGEKTPEISLHTAANPMGEVVFAARTISRLVKEQGLRYREIAVIAGDLPSYGNYVKKTFEEYEIPFFIDQTVQVLLNPCLEFIRGAFGIADSDFSYESVFRFLRTGFAGLSETETDRLENYVLARGIRGKILWQQEWAEATLRLSEEEAAVCNEYRQRLMDVLTPWLEIFQQSRGKLRDYAEALYNLLVRCGIQEQLKIQEEQFHREGLPDKEKEYKQIYPVLIGMLDEAVELLGDETVTRKEFQEILEAGFSEARIGIIPPGIDEVHVGDMERTRLNHIKALFFIGLNDGWIPAKEGRGGIVSEMEREFLQEAGVELAPTARENGYIQRFYLYLDLTKPRERLYLSYCKNGSDGKAMRPSYLISTIHRLFPHMELTDEDEGRDFLRNIVSLKTGLAILAERLRDLREEYEEKSKNEVKELLRQYLAGDCQGRAEELLEAAFLSAQEENLTRNTAGRLYGELLENSVTRLEEFAACAFAHFADYGLGLSEREEYQVRSADIGNIFHRALELFSQKLERSKYNWFNVPDHVRDLLMEQSVEETVETYGSRIFFASARNQYTIQRMKRILRRSVWALHEQIKAGVFIPSGFEISFLAAEDLNAVNLALGESKRMRLKGRIDRIDTCMDGDKVYVKVIDYKSGNTSFDLVSFYYGLQLQLVVYLNAALEMERKLHPEKEIVPAGIFYYRLKDPLAEGEHGQTQEEVEDAMLKRLRPDGIVNDDPAVVEKLDTGFEKASRVIPVSKKADGSWSAVSSVASTNQLQALSGFVQSKLETLGKEMMDGKIQVKPYRRKKNTACDYCVFADLCGFDRKIPGSAFRQLKEFPKEEIWKRLTPDQGGQ